MRIGPDPTVADSDGAEVLKYGTNPSSNDTDGDGLQQLAQAMANAVNVIAQWIMGQIRAFLNRLNNMLASMAQGYLGDVEDVFAGRKDLMQTSIYLHANIFGWSFIAIELGLGIFANIFTGGAWSTTAFAEDVGFTGLEESLSFATAYVIKIFAPLLGVVLGALLRAEIQKILDALNWPEFWKDTIMLIIDMVVVGLGILWGSKVIGSEDLKSLVAGYMAIVIFLLTPNIVKYLLPNATSEAIKVISAVVRAAILGWMMYTVIKAVLSTSPTDIVAGAIGMIDEIFLGFLMADAFISDGTMGQEYFEELLKNIGQSSGG